MVEEVISNGWLDQPPAAAYVEQIQGQSLALNNHQEGKAKEHYLWGLAGAIASSGKWKHFQSREQYYKLIMTF